MLETNRVNINELEHFQGTDIKYHPLLETEKWKIPVIKECIDAKFEKLTVSGLSVED